MSAPTLYSMPGSCALSCHIALEWAGVPYETERLSRDDLQDEAFLAINPKAKVPALRLEGGAVLTEALAILVHIAHEHADAEGLLPRDGLERARLLEALSELTGEFHPAFFPVHVPQRYTEDEAGQDAVRAAARGRVRAQYDRWAGRMDGRDWVLAAGRTVADPYLYVLCRWAGIVDADLAEWPALARFAARMEALPGVGAALAAEGVDPLDPGAARTGAA